ncbi:MAG: T9SS type A sorting domain-containing protein [Cytophagales bacterium]|tara:strand:- start:4814 stop:5143 length:330 start_codon:yes stop_codon:yes gene_type:complete
MKKLFFFIYLLSLSSVSFSQKKESNTNFEVYPNPAIDYINIKFDGKSNIMNKSFSVHSLIGNKVDITTENLSENTIRIPLRDLNSGFYFLSLTDKTTERREIVKFLKIN